MAVLIIHTSFKNTITEKVLKPKNKGNKTPINISNSAEDKKGKFGKKLIKKFMK